MIKVRRALLSVSDKEGLAEFARQLARRGVELCATGGTTAALRAAGLAVTAVEELTGCGEILDGRVKTLHPAVHAGVLADRDQPAHLQLLADRRYLSFDLVAVNLYPFLKLEQEGGDDRALTEAIDIGGVALLRAAAKNHRHVAALSSPAQYGTVIAELDEQGGVTRATSRALAAAAFRLTAAFDARVMHHLAHGRAECLALEELLPLRYGENPHQEAVLYSTGNPLPLKQLQGKEISYNNLLDLDTAIALLHDLKAPAAAVIKHGNPCGAKAEGTPVELYAGALRGDPEAAFGGVLGFTVPVDAPTARELTTRFWEVVAAPGYDPEARALLAAKEKLTVLELPPVTDPAGGWEYRSVFAGILKQQKDRLAGLGKKTVVSKRPPTESEWRDLEFANRVVKHVRSNAIVIAKDGELLGVGAGQMSRVESCRIALDGARRRGRELAGAVLASDGFFPFRDTLELAAAAGLTAFVEPGGSKRDAESVAAADAGGGALVFTGTRHFRH